MKSEEKIYRGLNYQNADRGRQSRLSEFNSDAINKESRRRYTRVVVGKADCPNIILNRKGTIVSDAINKESRRRYTRVVVGRADCPYIIRTQSTKKKGWRIFWRGLED